MLETLLLDGARRPDELARDRGVRAPAGHQHEHLALAWRQDGEAGVAAFVGARAHDLGDGLAISAVPPDATAR